MLRLVRQVHLVSSHRQSDKRREPTHRADRVGRRTSGRSRVTVVATLWAIPVCGQWVVCSDKCGAQSCHREPTAGDKCSALVRLMPMQESRSWPGLELKAGIVLCRWDQADCTPTPGLRACVQFGSTPRPSRAVRAASVRPVAVGGQHITRRVRIVVVPTAHTKHKPTANSAERCAGAVPTVCVGPNRVRRRSMAM